MDSLLGDLAGIDIGGVPTRNLVPPPQLKSYSAPVKASKPARAKEEEVKPKIVPPPKLDVKSDSPPSKPKVAIRKKKLKLGKKKGKRTLSTKKTENKFNNNNYTDRRRLRFRRLRKTGCRSCEKEK